MESSTKRPHKRGPIILSIGISLAIHVIGLYLVLKNPLIIEKAFQSLKSEQNTTAELENDESFDPKIDELIVVEAPPMEGDTALDITSPSSNAIHDFTLSDIEIPQHVASPQIEIALNDENETPYPLRNLKADRPKRLHEMREDFSDLFLDDTSQQKNQLEKETIASPLLHPRQLPYSHFQPNQVLHTYTFPDPVIDPMDYPMIGEDLKLINEDRIALQQGFSGETWKYVKESPDLTSQLIEMPLNGVFIEKDMPLSKIFQAKTERSFLDLGKMAPLEIPMDTALMPSTEHFTLFSSTAPFSLFFSIQQETAPEPKYHGLAFPGTAPTVSIAAEPTAEEKSSVSKEKVQDTVVVSSSEPVDALTVEDGHQASIVFDVSSDTFPLLTGPFPYDREERKDTTSFDQLLLPKLTLNHQSEHSFTPTDPEKNSATLPQTAPLDLTDLTHLLSDRLNRSMKYNSSFHLDIGYNRPHDWHGKDAFSSDLTKQAHKINERTRLTTRNLSTLPSLLELDTISFQDEFFCDVSVSPKRRDGRYLFAVTLQAKNPQSLKSINQNYTFLIDRSGNVDKTRYRTYRDAVCRALNYLNEGDTFNILLFDNDILKLSHHSVFYSEMSIKNAKKFLTSQDKGFGFSDPNVYDLLTRMGRIARSSGQHNTVFLLTNGKSLELSTKRNKDLKDFFLDYQGEYSLYIASASQGNRDRILDLISRTRKGEYMHTPTFASFSRKLCSLVKKAGRVIAKNVHVTPINIPKGAEVILFPGTNQLGDLFNNRPFTIYGLTNKLEDIELVFQAKSEADWFNIRKTIALSDAEPVDRSIEKEYAFYHSFNAYEKYLSEGLKFYLEEASKMLQIE